MVCLLEAALTPGSPTKKQLCVDDTPGLHQSNTSGLETASFCHCLIG